MPLVHTVILHGLPRGQAYCAIGIVTRELIEYQPLLWRTHSARHAHAHHEGERRFQFLLLTFHTQIAIILHVAAMKLEQLAIVLADTAGHFILQGDGQIAAQIVAGGLERFFDDQLGAGLEMIR